MKTQAINKVDELYIKFQDEIIQDLVFDFENPFQIKTEYVRGLNLASKYYRFHMKFIEVKAKVEEEKADIEKTKFLYYKGTLSKEKIEEYGWDFDPFHGLKITTKENKDIFINADVDINKAKAAILKIDAMIENAKSIIKQLQKLDMSVANINNLREEKSLHG